MMHVPLSLDSGTGPLKVTRKTRKTNQGRPQIAKCASAIVVRVVY
jgi:hypothetical protein